MAAASSQDAGPPSTPVPGAPEEPPMTPQFGATSSSAIAAGAGGVVLSETQLGSMALRAKQQRTKAEQDKQLLQVRPHTPRTAPSPARRRAPCRPVSAALSLSWADGEDNAVSLLRLCPCLLLLPLLPALGMPAKPSQRFCAMLPLLLLSPLLAAAFRCLPPLLAVACLAEPHQQAAH